MSTLSLQNGHDLRRPPPPGPFLSRRRPCVEVRPRCFATRKAPYVSERNVVVVRSSAATCRRHLEVACVGRNVGLGLETLPSAVPAVLAAAEELNGIGNDIHRLALVPVVVLPLAPLEAPVERDRTALGQVAGAVLALRTPDGDVEVDGLVDPVARLVVLAAGVAGDPQLADGHAARQVPEIRVVRQVPREDDAVDVRGCHWWHSFVLCERLLAYLAERREYRRERTATEVRERFL